MTTLQVLEIGPGMKNYDSFTHLSEKVTYPDHSGPEYHDCFTSVHEMATGLN